MYWEHIKLVFLKQTVANLPFVVYRDLLRKLTLHEKLR